MKNVTIKVEGKALIITVPDYKAAGSPSSSGKTKLVASTAGAVAVDCGRDGLKVALNVTVPNK